MKISRLYTKIFLSFLGILIITEVLIFMLFIYFAGRHFRDRFEQHTRNQITFVKEFVEDRIRSEPLTPVSQNKALKDLILQMGESYGASFWLTGPDGTTLAKSFNDRVPTDVEKGFSRKLEGGAESFKIYKDFGEAHRFYVLIPIQLTDGQTGNLHALFESTETGPHKGGFAVGLVVIGVIIALLVVPVSRQITKPLSRLRRSAIRISEGDLSHRSSVTGKDELGQLGRTFNVMAQRLERMIRGGKELTANVSHELRSPLARIRVAEEIIREQLKTGDLKRAEKHLNAIREDIHELDRLIGRILEFSKLDIHDSPFESLELDLSAFLRGLLDRYQTAMEKAGLTVITELPARAIITGDRKGLQSALSNLLDNAVKFAPKGGEVKVRLIDKGDQWQLCLANTYQKLSDHELERFFEPFFRVEGVQEAGTGLGLAITRRIIERHGGHIRALNAENGLELVMLLPK
ncbi:MAG: HAMP domain-containing histidine kinase [Deltaproteobacteria bacterium]|nr:HAMP domain-containing histidine kinase [Deltaproteobacteria bacterium]